MVLVDSGSSHNFISGKVARHLHLPITSTNEFNVRIADRGQLCCQEKHEAVTLEIQGFSFAVEERIVGYCAGHTMAGRVEAGLM